MSASKETWSNDVMEPAGRADTVVPHVKSLIQSLEEARRADETTEEGAQNSFMAQAGSEPLTRKASVSFDTVGSENGDDESDDLNLRDLRRKSTQF